MFNLAVKKIFEKNLPLKVYGNLNACALITRILCAEGMRNAILRNDLKPSIYRTSDNSNQKFVSLGFASLSRKLQFYVRFFELSIFRTNFRFLGGSRNRDSTVNRRPDIMIAKLHN